MQRGDFQYDLPEELIARHPCPVRSASRLLCLDPEKGTMDDRRFVDLPGMLQPGDLLVFNDTRVIPARLFGRKETGGRVEVLVERVIDEHRILAHVRASKSPHAGASLILEDQLHVQVIARKGDLFELEFPSGNSVLQFLDSHGHVPLPPYINRSDEADDLVRYQTVYARVPGAVAAPTAGLHFDAEIMDQVRAHGVETAFVTLHVGAGTFQPVRVDDLADHVMHREHYSVNEDVCQKVRATRQRGGRVVAVGTTVVRSLESASSNGFIEPCSGETDLFITPGYRFTSVDALLTNFHLPESTLLMLVCAFAGRESVFRAYRHAIRERYRFFSYGDAMYIGSLAH